jgi:O-antigen ligase
MNVRIKSWVGQATPLFYLCALVMVSSLLLGGGTRDGFVSDAILQLLAIPLLLVSLWKLFEVCLSRRAQAALVFCLAIAVLPLLQLIPLPPWLWTALPGRATLQTAFDIIGRGLPWMPISVSPQATWLSALSLLPPVAIFLGTVLLAYRERRWLSLVLLAVGTVSVFIGLIQVAQGPESPWRFFQITNPSEAVGFFANRNHYAALLYALILLATAWTVHATVGAGAASHRRELNTGQIVASIGGFTLLVVLLAGEAMARSRAGLGLTILALFAAFALGFSDRRAGPGITSNKVLFGAIALAVIFAVQYALYRILDRFAVDPVQDARLDFFRPTVEAARAYMPVGSGLGTFVPVYALFETPEGVLANYVNRAHNDVLEVWLETGAVGLVLMGLFAIWFVRRAVQIWRSAPAQAREIDWSLARAATIVVALVILHSFVDYPLRTGAMMAVMAFACALLVEPPASDEGREEPPLQIAAKQTRHRERRRTELVPSPAPVGSPAARDHGSAKSDVPPRSQDRRWGADINWPKEWSTPSKPGSPGENDEPPSTSKETDK